MLVNSSVADPAAIRDAQVIAVPALEIARAADAPNAAGFVMLGAYATLRRIVDVAALGEAMRELVPPYRAQHVAANLRALEAGAGRAAGMTAATARQLLDGRAAITESAIAAGCRFFAGYPISPFTGLLENMSRRLPEAEATASTRRARSRR